ncbi:glycosyltransferase [Caballeronia sp. LZ062]|uniref:glycosyltransferase family 2 protein n=1 Tax=unclassified Caballeronia TaxID=2646786 RepID=UPI00285CAA30|nr:MULTISPECIES: glycosyltransferase [unclassified Caballeronia]MDR5857723.1 glycosyltransferase [Caballeronia sp. LZ050]MDR5869273.1 glycosyltransferase [Caballeronia sp. LZ062]
MSVSVIVPAYNAQDFICVAPASLQSQTLAPLEIIVVNDASTDETAKVVGSAATEDSRIRLINLESNLGPGGARNAGIEAAHGDWIALLDADDRFAPERLERLVKLGDETNADIVTDNLLIYDAVARKIVRQGFRRKGDEPHFNVTLDSFLYNAAGESTECDFGLLMPIFRRKTLLERRLHYPVSLRHGEDFHLMLDALLSGCVWVCTKDAYYLYTERMGSISKAASGMSRTKVNYRAMRAATDQLLSRPQISSNPRLRALVARRSNGLKWLDAKRDLIVKFKSEGPASVLKVCAKDPWVAWNVGRFLFRRVSRKLNALGHAALESRSSQPLR